MVNITFKSAIRFSVVPGYRHIASLIGAEMMQSYVASFEYGNKNISSGVDNFWLNGSLKVTAHEQIEFLKKFYHGQLKVSAKTTKLVKNILLQEQTEHYKLSGKTGAGHIGKNRNIVI